MRKALYITIAAVILLGLYLDFYKPHPGHKHAIGTILCFVAATICATIIFRMNKEKNAGKSEG